MVESRPPICPTAHQTARPVCYSIQLSDIPVLLHQGTRSVVMLYWVPIIRGFDQLRSTRFIHSKAASQCRETGGLASSPETMCFARLEIIVGAVEPEWAPGSDAGSLRPHPVVLVRVTRLHPRNFK
jgi:hypothetical protein